MLFFPHKGLNYGDGFGKYYYYDIVKAEPKHVMHVEYGVFNQDTALNLANKYELLGLHHHFVHNIPLRTLYALRHFPWQAGN